MCPLVGEIERDERVGMHGKDSFRCLATAVVEHRLARIDTPDHGGDVDDEHPREEAQDQGDGFHVGPPCGCDVTDAEVFTGYAQCTGLRVTCQ